MAAAHANEFISQLPEGYASHLGEQGVRLHADNIAVLDQGRLVATGTHSELLLNSPPGQLAVSRWRYQIS